MADTAYQAQYREEFIAQFEQSTSALRETVTVEGDVKGNQITFLVAGSGTDTATTRGTNGLIPARQDTLTQYAATLVEYNDLRIRTSFNIWASQGNGRQILQRNSMAVMNRTIDQDIIAALNTGTQDTGVAATMTLSMAMKCVAILGNADVPIDNEVFGLITPAAYAYLIQNKEVSSKDYVDNQLFKGGMARFDWAGIHWIVHSNLPGAGGASEKCFVYHKSAIGHGCDMERLVPSAGYNEEQDYSWARTTGFMGSKLLQDTGVVVINHDGSGFAAA